MSDDLTIKAAVIKLLDDILSGAEPQFQVFEPTTNVDFVFEHIDGGECKNWIDHFPELATRLFDVFYSRDLTDAEIEEGYAKLRKYLGGMACELLDFEATEAYTRITGG